MSKKPKPQLDPTKAVAYLRVSTEKQDLSPDAQRRDIKNFAASQDLTIVSWHLDDGVSGSLPADQRPGLSAAIQDLSDLGAGLLLVAKRDRLARDILIAAATTRIVEQLGARIESANGMNENSAEGEFIRGMLDLMAQHERALIKRRTKDALQVKREKGEKLGGAAPYGFQTTLEGETRMLVENPQEQAIIAKIVELSSSMSPAAVAKKLNAEKVPPRGSKWFPTTVARILSREN